MRAASATPQRAAASAPSAALKRSTSESGGVIPVRSDVRESLRRSEDGYVDAGLPGLVDEGDVGLRVPEQLGDGEAGASGLLEQKALDFLFGIRSGRRIARGEGCDRDRQRAHCRAQRRRSVRRAAARLDAADERDELGGRRDAAQGRPPIGAVGGRVSAQGEKGSNVGVKVILYHRLDGAHGRSDAGQMGNRIDGGVAGQSRDDVSRAEPVLPSRAICDGDEIRLNGQQSVDHRPEGRCVLGAPGRHNFEGNRSVCAAVAAFARKAPCDGRCERRLKHGRKRQLFTS